MTIRTKTLAGLAAIAVGIGGYISLLYDPAPIANPDRATATDLDPTEINVLLNDTDWKGGVITLVSVGLPDHGSTSISSDGTHLIYSPNPGFAGQDTFDYEISDASGQVAYSSVSVDVTFTEPEFHRRSTSASLQEMLSEPATSIYGSTIDVFVFRDSSGEVREITISGHADSLTCSVASAAFASTLIESGLQDGDFLLAGAGRLSVPALTAEARTVLLSDPDVQSYITLSQDLETARAFLSLEKFTEQQISEVYGWTLAQGQAQLEALSKRNAVRTYFQTAAAGDATRGFLDQIEELRDVSGMLRLHERDFDIVGVVHKRMQDAARSGVSTVLNFADISQNGPTVVYSPMLAIGTGDPIVLEIPVGDFSSDGFRVAAAQHRSAMEKAIESSAQRRFDHASRILDQEQRTENDCKTATSLERAATIQTESCNRDECGAKGASLLSGLEIDSGQQTFGEYCENTNPGNLFEFAQWKEDARFILDRMKLLRDVQDSVRVDALTHSALIDSMLRDWALPIPDAQAAFDHWREVGRADAWRSLTTAMVEQGIARAAISGESIVFDVALVGDTLTIRPIIAIDLAQSRIVVDPSLGALSAVTPWEMREITQLTIAPELSGDLIENLFADPKVFQQALVSDPSATLSDLIDSLFARLPEHAEENAKRLGIVELGQVQQISELLLEVLKEENESRHETTESQFDSLQRLAFTMQAFRDLDGLNPDLLSVAIYLNARAFVAILDGSDAQAWQFANYLVLEGQLDNSRLSNIDSVRGNWLSSGLSAAGIDTRRFDLSAVHELERSIYGSNLNVAVTQALAKQTEADQAIIRGYFGNSPAALPVLSDIPDLPVLSVIDGVVSEVETARSTLLQRQAIDNAIGLFDENGRVSISAVRHSLEAIPANQTPFGYVNRNNIISAVRSLESSSNRDMLGAIDGNRLAVALVGEINALNALLINIKPRLVGLRYGRDQDAIAARLLFDEGAYLEALDLLIYTDTPLSLYAPNISWEIIEPALKVIPDGLRLRSHNETIDVEAKVLGEFVPVLRLSGLTSIERKTLAGSDLQPLLPWNEGDFLWEQILLAVVPARPEAQQIADVFSDAELRLATLKAMVYACAVPGSHLLEPGGRCTAVKGSTELYDRVRNGAVSFNLPEENVIEARAIERFSGTGAWLLRRDVE